MDALSDGAETTSLGTLAKRIFFQRRENRVRRARIFN